MTRWIVCVALFAASELRAEDPNLAPLEAGRWELGAEAGSGSVNGYLVFVGYQPRADLRVDARAIHAVNDRLQLNAIFPSVEYRFAPGGDVAVLVHGGVLALSVHDDQFLYQTPQDAFVVVPPADVTRVTPRITLGAGAAVRLLRPRHVWTFSAQASTTRAFSGDPLTLPFFTMDLAAGFTWRAADRVTLHLAAGLTNSAGLPHRIFTSPPALTLGSVQQLGVRRPPLVRVRLLDGLYLDASAGAWLGITGRVEAMGGVTWVL